MKRKFVLKNKRRFFSILIVLSVLLTSALLATNAYGSVETGYETVTVQHGDTLWNIADKYNKSGDIRRMISDIKEANGINDNTIYEGDILRIPV